MHMIYNSKHYCVLEFGLLLEGQLQLEQSQNSGYEIVDKSNRREIYLDGMLAETFRKGVSELLVTEPTFEEVDEFLGQFDCLMQQPVTLH